MNRKRRSRQGEAGYSLMEILIALAIIALLIGVAGPRIFALFERGKAKIAEIQIEQLQQGLDLYRLDMRRYPTTVEGLQALLQRPGAESGRWSGPYLDKVSGVIDPWDNPYAYRSDAAGAYELMSLGADGAPGGDGEDADIRAQ
ncbi:MAG: type II secretion system major pseudopilin GspG [Pseudomonadota bacterium]